MRVDALGRTLVQANKLVEQESASSIIVITPSVLGEVVLHGRNR